MQIAILVEQMRREGHEVLVSRPEVLWKKDANGNPLEPIEKLFVEVPSENLGGRHPGQPGAKRRAISPTCGARATGKASKL